jgi:uncharacterized protein (DUF1697 family)
MKYVALLRGINVGGNNRVEMKKLKAVFEALGFDDVVTYINSGNVVFATKKMSVATLEKKIETAIETEFGFPVAVLVRDEKNIATICKGIPIQWVNNAEMRTDVLFLWNEIDSSKIVKEFEVNAGIEHLKYIDGAVVWDIKKRDYNKSRVPKIMLRKDVYQNITIRNVNTLRKLQQLLSE